MADVEKQPNWHPLVIMSLTCGSLNQFFKPLIDQGLTGKDTYLILTGKDVNDPKNQSDPAVIDYKQTLTAQGLDPNLTTYASGWYSAFYMVNVLQKAATFQGGLDRGNIMLAARDITDTMPLTIDGLTDDHQRDEGRLPHRGRPDGAVQDHRPQAARHVPAGRRPDQPRGSAGHLRHRAGGRGGDGAVHAGGDHHDRLNIPDRRVAGCLACASRR